MKDKLNRRKYFVGNKKLKHVKLFETFDRTNESSDYRKEAEKFGITIEDSTFDGQAIERWTIGKNERFHSWERAMDWLISQWKKDEDLFDFFRTNLSTKDDVVIGNYELAANDVMDHMRWAKNEATKEEEYVIRNKDGYSLGYDGSSSNLRFAPNQMPITFYSKTQAQEFIDRNKVKNPFILSGEITPIVWR